MSYSQNSAIYYWMKRTDEWLSLCRVQQHTLDTSSVGSKVPVFVNDINNETEKLNSFLEYTASVRN